MPSVMGGNEGDTMQSIHTASRIAPKMPRLVCAQRQRRSRAMPRTAEDTKKAHSKKLNIKSVHHAQADLITCWSTCSEGGTKAHTTSSDQNEPKASHSHPRILKCGIC